MLCHLTFPVVSHLFEVFEHFVSKKSIPLSLTPFPISNTVHRFLLNFAMSNLLIYAYGSGELDIN